MRNVFIFFAFLIAGMAHAQIITNVDNLRIRDVEQGLESDKILVIDSDNVVRWIDAIEVDLSDYYTISEVDAFVADLEAELLERYTKDEVDALLDGLELRLDDYYTKTDVDSIITNVNDRIDSLELEVEQIDLNTVTSVDNVTSIKIRGSDIFTNNLETDFAQIADVNKAGFGLISMQSEMKIGLVAKDGTTLLDDVDLSWLASGDLAVTIDDTDPNNPELVFSQNGVEVARIPASTLLSGVARSANLSNYILQFKDGTGAVVYSVNLEPLFEDYFTKAEANDRFALRTRTISAGNGLTGGGNLTANRTIGLSTDTQEDIAKGVEAHGWGDHNGNYLKIGGYTSVNSINYSGDLNLLTNAIVYASGANYAPFGRNGTVLSIRGSSGYGWQLGGRAAEFGHRILENGVWSDWREVWDDGNLPNPATQSWVNNQGFLKTAQAPLTNSTTNTISGNQVRREALVGDVTAPFNSNTTTIANNAVTLPKLGADVRSAIDSKEPKLSAGTLAQLMTGTNTQNRKWSAKVINDFVERKQTEASVITAKGYSAALPETSPKPLYLNITTVNQLGLVNDDNTTVKLPISDATYEISIIATGGYTPLQNAYIVIYFGGKIRGVYINADMSSFSYQTEVFTVTKESEREIRVAQTTVLENLEITVTIKKISE